MSEKISWSVFIDVSAGPKLAAKDLLEVEAYDKIAVRLEAGATDVDVEIQPGGAGQVSLLMIKSSIYDAGLTYSPDGGATTIPLDAPLVLIGAGAVSLLADAPQVLRWSNETAEVAQIEVFVGRDATA
jgi:hypothetical protein